MNDEKPSLILSEYASRADQLSPGQTLLTLISEDPFIAVGVEGGSDTPYVLVLPEGSVFEDQRSENLRVIRSREMNLRFEESEFRSIQRCTSVSFRNLSQASQLLLDVLVETAADTEDSKEVAELTQDFIELFTPSRALSFEELLGLFGELFVIWSSDHSEVLARAWHQRERDQYDFALENDRLEIKTTRGPERRHRFSSNQIPPREGLQLSVVSIVTDEVSAGMSVVDLFNEILLKIGPGTTARNLTKHFSRTYQRGEDLCEGTYFDWKQARKTIFIFEGDSIPSLDLVPGIVSAKWEADLSNVRPTSKSSNSLTNLVVRPES